MQGHHHSPDRKHRGPVALKHRAEERSGSGGHLGWGPQEVAEKEALGWRSGPWLGAGEEDVSWTGSHAGGALRKSLLSHQPGCPGHPSGLHPDLCPLNSLKALSQSLAPSRPIILLCHTNERTDSQAVLPYVLLFNR